MSSRALGADQGSSGHTKGPDAGLGDLESGLEATVCAYLRHHPAFFVRNRDLLGQLQVPHATAGAVSLIEHQVTVLRRQLETEKGRLSHLINRAREYESLSNRLHALVLQIIPARGMDALGQAMHDALTRELRAEAVALRLFPVDPEACASDDPLLAAFHEFLGREHALCGPLQSDRACLLFGPDGERVKSAAIMPIRAEGRSGVLAIGAADPERFGTDMGTDLLDRLAQIVSCKLISLPAEALEEIGSMPETSAQDAGEPSSEKDPEAPSEMTPGA